MTTSEILLKEALDAFAEKHTEYDIATFDYLKEQQPEDVELMQSIMRNYIKLFHQWCLTFRWVYFSVNAEGKVLDKWKNYNSEVWLSTEKLIELFEEGDFTFNKHTFEVEPF